MKRLAFILFVPLLVGVCFPTTVYLRKGGTIKGEVISKDDEKFVIKTADGEETIKWRQLKNKSIEEIHPELYDALKAKVLEKKKKKEEKTTVKNEEDFSSVELKVKTTELSGGFKRKSHTSSARKFQKECYGIISISLSRLNPKKNYTVKTVYSHYLKAENKENMVLEKPTDEKDIVKEKNMSGKSNYEIKYKTSPYYIYKLKAKSDCYIKKVKKARGKYLTKIEFGYKPNGWDISIWLDGKLIYKEEKEKDKNYLIVKKL